MQMLSTGCRGRRKLTKQLNAQLVGWYRVTWEGKTSGCVISAAQQVERLKSCLLYDAVPDFLKVGNWTSLRINLSIVDSLP